MGFLGKIFKRESAEDREKALEEAARRNECIVLKGHAEDEMAVGTYAISDDGRTRNFTQLEVARKRAELGLDNESGNADERE